MPNDVRIIDCGSASALLDAISLRGDSFHSASRGSWAFRGHSDAAWSLVPAAFRDDRGLILGMYSSGEPWSEWTNRDQIHAEADTLRAFVRESDGAGFPIPLDSSELRDALTAPFKAWYVAKFEAGEVVWPPRIALPVIALAQHYGLATRCLDWSRSPAVAAYFAAIGAVAGAGASTHFAIWAFSLVSDSVWKGLEGPFGGLPERPAMVVDAPYASNPNLRAQEGLFITVPVARLPFDAPAERLDFALQLRQVNTYRDSAVVLYKFVAPREIAGEVLWYLAREGVSASRLFPGYDGAARGVLELKLHQNPLFLRRGGA